MSLAVTFCRGRSHDDFYFHRPEQITGDPPPLPYVDVKSVPIFRRVLAKEVLRQAFRTVPEAVREQATFALTGGPDSVHGEFGPAAAWQMFFRRYVHDWLAPPGERRSA